MTLHKAYRTAQNIVEKRLHYKFWDKERERSNRAAGLAEKSRGDVRRVPRCPSFPPHNRIAWSGPPYDSIRAYICLECKAMASEPEIASYGFDFDLAPDWIILPIFDLDLQRQVAGKKMFAMFRGK